MQVNYVNNKGPQFSVISSDQAEMIFLAALEVMERTGGRFFNEEALELFKQSDAVVTDGNLVRIPSFMVQRALNDTPPKVTIASRNKERKLHLSRNQVYFGTGSDCPFIYDRETGERRRYTFRDVCEAARLVDALPNLDFFMSHGLVHDVPSPKTYDRHQYLAMVTNTEKPLVITAVDREGLRDIYEMALLICGSEEEFRVNPLFAVYIEPSSPLTHSKTCLEKLLFCAKKSVPVIYTSCPSAGATAPATLAGMLVLAMAETLQGMVLAHLNKPGMPLIMGGVVTIMDMKTSTYSYGAPELSLASAALTDVSKYLNLPMFSTAGCSDAKTVDEQAALEAVISIETAFLSGASLVHDIGYLDSGLNGSFEMLVMCDEIIGMVKHIGKGITVDEEHLAADLIDRVSPGGQFLDTEHTLRHYKKDFYFPRLLDRYNRETWEAKGRPVLNDYIRKNMVDILDNYQPNPLPDDVVKNMQEIIRRADDRVGNSK